MHPYSSRYCVYLATSPLLTVVRTGCWTGSKGRLLQRHRCSYGIVTMGHQDCAKC